jgi:hypothetical protein
MDNPSLQIGMHVMDDEGEQEPGLVTIMLPMDAIRVAQVLNALAMLGFIPVNGYQLDAVQMSFVDSTAV